MKKQHGVITKIGKNLSLSLENIRWIMARALELSTVEHQVNPSEYVDGLLTRERMMHEEEKEHAKHKLRAK